MRPTKAGLRGKYSDKCLHLTEKAGSQIINITVDLKQLKKRLNAKLAVRKN